MTHPGEEMILAVRDREPVAREVLAHLEECAACGRALEDARSRADAVEAALAALTVPVRAARRAEEASGAGSADGAGRSGPGHVHPRRGRGRRGGAGEEPLAVNSAEVIPIERERGTVWTLRWLGRAAVLLLIGAGALSALPGPFTGWIPRMFSVQPPPDAPPPAGPEPTGQVGGRMEVSTGPLVVRLESVPPGTVVDVRRVAGQAVGVLAGTGSEFAYGTGEVRASIVAGPVVVELPEGVAPATLVVNGAVYLVVDAAGMEVSGPTTAAGGGDLATFRVPN